LFEHISAIAVTVVSGALLMVGGGVVAIGNRSRRSEIEIKAIKERCAVHGLATSDIPERLTTLEAECIKFREFAETREKYIGRLESLETTMKTRIKVGERGLLEMRSGHATFLARIDALDEKMLTRIDKVETTLMNEIHRVNGKIK